MSENNNNASNNAKEETEWIGRYIISSSSGCNTNPITATTAHDNCMLDTLSPQRRHKTKNRCSWTPPPPTRKQVQFLLQSLSLDIPDLTKTFKNDIEKKAVDDDTTISTFPSQPGYMDDALLSLDATDTISASHIVESTDYKIQSRQELPSSSHFECTTIFTDMNQEVFDREGIPMKEELVFVKSGTWEHANILSKQLPSCITQNLTTQDQDEAVSRGEDSSSFSDMSSEQLKSMSPCRSTPTRQTQSDDSHDAATAFFVPIVMCLLDIPTKRYELVLMMIDWSSNTSVRQLLQELDNAIASKVGELQANLDNESKKYSIENKGNRINEQHSTIVNTPDNTFVQNDMSDSHDTLETNRFGVFPLEKSSGETVHENLKNHQQDTSTASLCWSTRYDGLIQHRSPSKRKPMMMINCFDLEKYEVTEYEVFVAKPAHYSSKEISLHSEDILKELIDIGVITRQEDDKQDDGTNLDQCEIVTKLSPSAVSNIVPNLPPHSAFFLSLSTDTGEDKQSDESSQRMIPPSAEESEIVNLDDSCPQTEEMEELHETVDLSLSREESVEDDKELDIKVQKIEFSPTTFNTTMESNDSDSDDRRTEEDISQYNKLFLPLSCNCSDDEDDDIASDDSFDCYGHASPSAPLLPLPPSEPHRLNRQTSSKSSRLNCLSSSGEMKPINNHMGSFDAAIRLAPQRIMSHEARLNSEKRLFAKHDSKQQSNGSFWVGMMQKKSSPRCVSSVKTNENIIKGKKQKYSKFEN